MAILSPRGSSQNFTLTVTTEEVLGLVYHQLFSYPLKVSELGHWSVGEKVTQKISSLDAKVEKITGKLKYEGDYIYIADTKQVMTRKLRNEISSQNIKTAKSAAKLLEKIPSIKFVGITGSLAMRNSTDDSDIDLIIVCSPDTLWSTRLISLLMLKILRIGVRNKNSKQTAKALCINIWTEEDNIVFRKRSIYTAHEIVQILPLVDNGDMFKKLLKKNSWVSNYWPNALKYKINKQITIKKTTHFKLLIKLFRLFNNLSWVIQKKYMQKSITNEKISKKRAMFHPIVLSDSVEQSFYRLVDTLGR